MRFAKFPFLLLFAALAVFAGLAFSACSAATPCAYGQGACASDNQCVAGLVCTAGMCNQPPVLCDNMPQSWQNPQLVSGNGSPGGSPYAATLNQTLGTGSAAIKSSSSFFGQGWFSEWNTLGLLGVGVSVVIIALAAMMGYAFNLTEVKAFAKSEMMQAVISILLIAGLMGLVQFFDLVAIQAVDSMNLPVSCNPTEPCYLTAAKEYINSVQSVANQSAQNSLKESYERMRVAQRGMNIQFNVWFLAFAGTNTQWNAGETIQAERAGALFESTVKLMMSLYAQKYFLETVAFGIAPVLLLLGIILRTFYFTRKLGGLLLSIAISLFIVYPLTFVFAWFTLNVTVYGERSIAAADASCPAECTVRYPVAFYTNSSGSIIQFGTMQEILRAQINSTNWAANAAYPGLVACRDLSKIGLSNAIAPPACPGCPDYCREVPFPASLPGCNITQCSACNAGCKLMRQRFDCPLQCDRATCSSDCLTKQPVENKCYIHQNDNNTLTLVPANLSVSCASCDACPNWCKIVFRNATGQYELTNKAEAPCQVPACLPSGTAMKNNDGNTVNGICPMQCLYVAGILGTDNSCNALCTDSDTGAVCPTFCRVQNLSGLGGYDFTTQTVGSICTGTEFFKACSICPDSCKIPVLPESATNNPALCAPYPQSVSTVENCTACPVYCRFNAYADYKNFSNLFTNSNSSLIPGVCGNDAVMGQNCSSPTSCGAGCKAITTPVLCETFNATATNGEYCNMCPQETRGLTLKHNLSSGATESVTPIFSADVNARCQDAICSPTCKMPMNLSIPAECLAYTGANPVQRCNNCPEETRGLMLHHINADSSEQTVPPALSGTVLSGCADSACAPYCKRGVTAEVPNSTANPLCRDVSPDTNTQTAYNDVVVHGSGTSPINLGFPPAAGTGTLVIEAQVAPGTYSQSASNGAVVHGSGSSSASLLNTPIMGTGALTVTAQMVAGKKIAVSLNGVSLGNMSSSPKTWSGLDLVAGSNTVDFAGEDPLANVTGITISSSYLGPSNISVRFNGVLLGNMSASPQSWSGLTAVSGINNVVFSSQIGSSNITNATLTTMYADDYDCNRCPISCRVNFAQGSWLDPSCNIPSCTARCSAACKATAPPASSPRFCKDYNGGSIDNCQQCPTRCRFTMSNDTWLDPGCNITACKAPNCEPECQSDSSPMVPMLCRGYKGNGPVNWGSYGCFGDASCSAYGAFSCGGSDSNCATLPTEAACNANSNCGWDLQECRQHSECYAGFASMPWSTSSPISGRPSPYNDASNCQQCPENCRVVYDNGVASTECDPNSVVDCTVGACAMGCRSTVRSPTSSSTCQPANLNSNSCANCPVLCRRFQQSMPPNESVFCDPTFCNPDKCIDECKLPNPPAKMCEDCADCPTDCLYDPPTRSDCTQFCSEESLAGPINVGPQDFIKNLPGAYGKEDAKNVGALMLPALVLPLFGLVMVISFIRVLSPLLGGDIEIPGLGRII